MGRTRWQRPNIKTGPRKDLGISVRSGWEANVCRWLTHQGIEWEYEPIRFEFPIKKGMKSYTPDLWLPETETWVEVKGHLPSTDKTKLKRFKKYHPEDFAKLWVIPGSPKTEAAIWCEEMGIPILAYYLDIKKQFSKIVPHWDE